jgi:CheY-like chemotaxis protein
MKAKRLHVMVVDDSALVLEHLRFALERAGHTVVTRESALGTVAHVMKVAPDALVLDVSMPALDGDRLAAVIAELRRNIVIILHSSLPASELSVLARQSGANGYITKSHDSRAFIGEFHRIAFGEVGQSVAKDPGAAR